MPENQSFHVERISMVLSGGNFQALARSAGVRPDHLVECRRVATLLPPAARAGVVTMPTALGLFRGETTDYVLAKAVLRITEPPLLEYLLLPGLLVRGLGGNLRYFSNYLKAAIPTEQRVEQPPLHFDGILPPTAEAQSEDLLALLGYCKNNIRTVGGLLAGLVQGMGLIVAGAPRSLETRLTFVQGLLTLLPGPARVGITFATYVADPSQTNTQIKFMDAPVNLDKHLVFNWETGKLLTDAPDDTYTKFILAQLRLDTSLVIEATDKLARTAVWRAMRRETMANALAWASKRASLDSAIKEGLPADRALVAAVLAEDPTLPDDLRVAYSKHLITLSLATDSTAHTEIIPAMAVQNKEIADAIYEQLWAAASTDRAMAVYHIAEHWVSHAPMGVDVTRWRPLLGMATMAHANALLNGDPTRLVSFLIGLMSAPPALQLDNVAAQIIGLCRKRSYENSDIARAVFLLAVTYLPTGGLQRLLSDTQLVGQLPVGLRAVFSLLSPTLREPAPPGALARAAESFGGEFQPIILGRLVDWAVTVQRLDLLDEPTLRGLVTLAGSAQAPRFDLLLQHVIQDLSQLNLARSLPVGSQSALVQMTLARRQFDAAVMQLVFYQDMLYPSANQDMLAKVCRDSYRHAPLEARVMLLALEPVQRSQQLKPLCVANAIVGALEARGWTSEMEPAMHYLTDLLYREPRLIAAFGTEPTLRLLQANADRRDAVQSLRLAGALVAYMLTFGDQGPAMVDRIFGLINWNAEVGEGALDVVRSYIRRAPIEQAAQVPRLLSRHGSEVSVALEATHRLRTITGGPDFKAFVERVQIAASLLFDLTMFFSESRELPSVVKLRRNVDSIPGGLSDSERDRLSENLTRVGTQIMRLNALHNARNVRRSRADIETRRAALIKNKIAPQSAVESLFWLGGYLGEGLEVPLALNREATGYMMGARSVNTLLRDIDQMIALFDGMLAAFPDDDQAEITRQAWGAEVDGLWAMLSLFTQREIRPDIIESGQLLAHLLLHVGERGNERSLQNNGHGRQLFTGRAQPRSVIDALRWLSGYFAQEHAEKNR